MATDAELNDYASLKKLAPYRKGKGRDRWDSKQAERLVNFREKVWPRAGTSQWGSSGIDETKKKRKGRKERERARTAAALAMRDGGAGSDLSASGAA
jgi:protein KRI1